MDSTFIRKLKQAANTCPWLTGNILGGFQLVVHSERVLLVTYDIYPFYYYYLRPIQSNTNHKNSFTFNNERDREQWQLRGVADMLVHHHLQLAAHLTFNKGCITVSLFIAAEQCPECPVGEWMNEMSLS